MRTGKAMFRAFLARLASGGFCAGLRARLFLFFFDITPLQKRQVERFPARRRVVRQPTTGRSNKDHSRAWGWRPRGFPQNLRRAGQAMRHRRMELTNEYDTDPILLDVAGAVNSLPDFGHEQQARQPIKSSG